MAPEPAPLPPSAPPTYMNRAWLSRSPSPAFSEKSPENRVVVDDSSSEEEQEEEEAPVHISDDDGNGVKESLDDSEKAICKWEIDGVECGREFAYLPTLIDHIHSGKCPFLIRVLLLATSSHFLF